MLDEEQVQEADAAITQTVTAFVSEFEVNVGEMGKRRPRVRHRERAAGTVHGIVRSGPRYQDRRRIGDDKVLDALAASGILS